MAGLALANTCASVALPTCLGPNRVELPKDIVSLRDTTRSKDHSDYLAANHEAVGNTSEQHPVLERRRRIYATFPRSFQGVNPVWS